MGRKNIATSCLWDHRSIYENFVDNGSDNDNVGDQESRVSTMSGPSFSLHLNANIPDNVGLIEEINHADVNVGTKVNPVVGVDKFDQNPGNVGEEIKVDLKRKGKAPMDSDEQPNKKQNFDSHSGPFNPSESFAQTETENIDGTDEEKN
ncbi:hypothetical protein KY290_022556 [Solanum tuberosum]|uniref:Uncharacterized protein n=1 Tax=Solanum tuberosum TaxID=4113 RepID=A0ABQ7V4R1_SOLTU|nr:hypothetical protein KY284_021460 [Solanum tuberosum]KAH0759063.1 hypothetical protein KY290_022556 [Solanum tuberosum]